LAAVESTVRIGLVGCVKTKSPVAAPAGELYVSPLFVGRRRFVEGTCDRWFILSALHGLVDPAEVIEPYDRTLVDVSVGERQAWAGRVLATLDTIVGHLDGVVFEVHAGAAYRDFGLVDGLRRRGAEVVVPAAGLSQGRQLAFYAGRAGPDGAVRAAEAPRRRTPSGYAGLGDWLRGLDVGRVTAGFADIEALLDRPLPSSARRHRAWWANHDGSPQARAWLEAGWCVTAVDLATARITFEKPAR
jgi:hypothetical protein